MRVGGTVEPWRNGWAVPSPRRARGGPVARRQRLRFCLLLHGLHLILLCTPPGETVHPPHPNDDEWWSSRSQLKAQTKPPSRIQPLPFTHHYFILPLLQKGGSITHAKTVETNAEGRRQKDRGERGVTGRRENTG